jgi:hypothetical protein
MLPFRWNLGDRKGQGMVGTPPRVEEKAAEVRIMAPKVDEQPFDRETDSHGKGIQSRRKPIRRNPKNIRSARALPVDSWVRPLGVLLAFQSGEAGAFRIYFGICG